MQPAPTAALADIPGLIRGEDVGRDELAGHVMEMTHAVYPHHQLYGRYCSIQTYIDCPPRDVFNYLSDVQSLGEWTYSTRNFRPTGDPGEFVGIDLLEDDTPIYCRVEANAAALTVDYHCAWDQGDELWMIYLMRVVDAEVVFKRPGSVVFWSNCRHPYYDHNPYPEAVSGTNTKKGRPWVGDYWDFFYAGHTIELNNLKAILEYRHAGGLPQVVAS